VTPETDPEIAVRQELATPFRYHLGVAPARESWLQRLFDAIARWWHALVSHFHGGARAESIAGDVVIVALVALLLYLIVRLVLAASIRRSAVSTDLESLVAERPEHRMAREASRAAESGDFLTAVRLILQAAILLLDLRGKLHDDASATLSELRRQVHALGDSAANPFGEIAAAYTHGVYAQQPVEESLWRRSRSAYDALRSGRL
jgi:hypothetical protein